MPRKYIVPPRQLSVRVVHPEPLSKLRAPHWPFDREALARVEAEMERRGLVLIRAVRRVDHWQAIEGSHRIYTAATRGYPVHVQEVGEHYRFQHDEPEYGVVTAKWLLETQLRRFQSWYDVEAWVE